MVWYITATSPGCWGASLSVGRVAHGARQRRDCWRRLVRACPKRVRLSWGAFRSDFKSLWKRSKIILIEAKIRKWWSANWVMWSHSSCAKLFQKYNVLTVFFIGIKELCTALADNAWLTANPEESLTNKLRLDALSIPNYVIKKGPTHGARHGKTEVQREYHLAWNAWKRCCQKVDSQGEHFTGIPDRFLRDPVYRHSQLAIGFTEQKCKEWDELAQEDHTYHLTPEEKKNTKKNGILTLNKEGKHGPMNLRSDFRAAVIMKKSRTPRIRRTNWRASPSRSIKTMAFIFKHIVVGQVWTRIGNELIRLFLLIFCSLQLVSFTVNGDPL